MFDLDKWKEIWATLRSNPLRTFLTAFGVFWGIFMLMAMLGFGSSMQSGSQKQMRGMATNLLFVWGQQTTEAYDGLPPGRGVRFNIDDIELLPKPLHRYDTEKTKTLDGALFAFVIGTDPELMLLLECDTAAAKPEWRFGVTRMNRDTVRLKRKGEKVWEALATRDHSPTDAYLFLGLGLPRLEPKP